MAEMGNPRRVVVFGGIGSGKSTFAALLASRGAVSIQADRIGHEILLSTGQAFDAVSERWPAAVADGEIDRGALAGVVFSDPAQLAELEAITHPLIAAEIDRRVAAAGDSPVVVELPLIDKVVGEGWTWVLVEAPRDLRLERAVARGGAPADIIARMEAQPGVDEWHASADWVVPNTGSLEDLEAAADEFWQVLTA